MEKIFVITFLFPISILTINAQWVGTTAHSTIYGRFDATYPTIGSGYFALKTNNANEQSGGLTIQYLHQGNLNDGILLNHNGSVGIGTITPATNSKLDVFGGISVAGQRALDSDENRILIGDLASGDGLRTLSLWSGDQERLFISSSGDIAIGSNQPTSKLDVRGTISAIQNQGNQVSIQTSTNRWDLDVDESFANNFRLRNITNGTVPFMVTTSGIVGIGTVNPDPNHKLSVNGSIRSKEVRVEANWPDFVFYDNYKLRTLEEVEQHIKEKGHLPEIPSEAEVTENGINVGEMNAKLLQKIEELTLYMIDMNKQVRQLKSENQELKQKVNRLENE